VIDSKFTDSIFQSGDKKMKAALTKQTKPKYDFSQLDSLEKQKKEML